MHSGVLQKYIELLRRYVGCELTHSSFEQTFLMMFKHEKAHLSIEEYSILQELFYVVESYCSDPTIRSDDDSDETGMLQAAKETLLRIENYLKD